MSSAQDALSALPVLESLCEALWSSPLKSAEWHELVRALPALGRLSLTPHVQLRAMNAFTRQTVILDGSGYRKRVMWTLPSGVQHSPDVDTPSCAIYRYGMPIEWFWRRAGILHRDNQLPAQIRFPAPPINFEIHQYWVDGEYRDTEFEFVH